MRSIEERVTIIKFLQEEGVGVLFLEVWKEF